MMSHSFTYSFLSLRIFKNLFGLIFFLDLYYLLAFIFASSFTNNVFVDGVNYLELISMLSSGLESFGDLRSSQLLFYIYYVLYPYFFLILLFNLVIVSVAFSFSNTSLLVFIIYAPFFVLSSILPSKDILVFGLLVVYMLILFRGYIFSSVIVSIFTFFVRDAMGLVMLMFIGIVWLRLDIRKLLFVLFFVVLVSSLYLYELLAITNSFMLERTLGYFQANGLEINNYLIRLIGNVTNLSSRAVFVSVQGYLSFTGIVLFLSGIGVFSAFLISTYVIFFRVSLISTPLYLSASLYLLILVLFSASPLVQPRYLIPVSFLVLSSYWYRCSDKLDFYLILFLSFTVSLLLMCVYAFSGYGLPEVTEFWY